jgi:hypothetical protein
MNATWHMAHGKACRCRGIPQSIMAELRLASRCARHSAVVNAKVFLTDQAVADGVGDTGFADRRVPRRRRQLSRDQRGRALTAMFDDLEEVTAFGIGERGEQPIVDG